MVYITQIASYSALDSVFELYISHAKSNINCSNQDSVKSGLLNVITSDHCFLTIDSDFYAMASIACLMLFLLEVSFGSFSFICYCLFLLQTFCQGTKEVSSMKYFFLWL